jgi:hypothetical protein
VVSIGCSPPPASAGNEVLRSFRITFIRLNNILGVSILFMRIVSLILTLHQI